MFKGSVGIGTTNPGRLLEVAGSINGTQLNISGATNLAYGSGNLGIGTTSPSSLLQVAGGVATNNATVTTCNVGEIRANVTSTTAGKICLCLDNPAAGATWKCAAVS